VPTVDFVQFEFKFFVVFHRNIQIVVKFLKYLELQVMQMQSIDSSCELECFVVVVEIVLELGCQQYCSEQHLVRVEIVKTEVLHRHVVSVDEDDRNHQALCWEARVLVESAKKLGERDGGYGGGIENGVAGHAFLVDEVGE